MEIEINTKNKQIILDVLYRAIDTIQKVSDSEQKKQSDKKRLVLFDLLYRQYPILNSIHILFEQYFTLNNMGNTLPIGLLMRCSLEDMLFAKYLLIYKDDSKMFENEILVQSRNTVKQYIEYLIKNRPDYWICSSDKKQEIKLKEEEDYNLFKIENPEFFNASGEIKSIKNLRKEIPNIGNYFNSGSINKQGPNCMHERLKSIDSSFSYIYFEYKFYCLFEHYSLRNRQVMELNEFTFGHLALSIELVLIAIVDILDYLNVNRDYLDEINEIKKSLGEVLKTE